MQSIHLSPAGDDRRARRAGPLAVLTLGLSLLLSACGGGGDSATGNASTAGSSSGGTTTSTTTGSPTTGGTGSSTTTGSTTPDPTPVTPDPVAVRLSGVAAFGSPLGGAQLRVVDARGAVVGSATTNAADGSYALVTQPALAPLMLQAVGVDALGQPVVLHGAVATLSASVVAHLTPITDAIVALTTGSEPLGVFAAAAANPAVLAPLGRLSAASDFVKTLIKTNLGDAKTGDPKKLDLLGDPAFAADKSGVDLALESLIIGYGTGSKGVQLQLGNKLGASAVEVTVDLATAQAELAKTTGAAPTKAITSTLKATTSPTSLMAGLAVMEELTASINRVMAEATGTEGAAVEGLLDRYALLAQYARHDGHGAAQLVEQLAGLAARNMQLGRMQVLGCADETIAKTGCARVQVALPARDATGRDRAVLVDAVKYDAKASPRWALVGNDRGALVAVQGTAWRELDATGAPLDGTGVARTGVQVWVGPTASAATVLTPGGYVLPLASCERDQLCLASPLGSGASVFTGALSDTTVFQGSSAWLGTADLAPSARYKATLTDAEGNVATVSAWLRSSFGSAPAADRFATLDGVSAQRALPAGDIGKAVTLSWASWAAEHPDQRVALVRRSYVGRDGRAVVVDRQPAAATPTLVELDEPVPPEDFEVLSATLWLAAVDTRGRWTWTSYRVLAGS